MGGLWGPAIGSITQTRFLPTLTSHRVDILPVRTILVSIERLCNGHGAPLLTVHAMRGNNRVPATLLRSSTSYPIISIHLQSLGIYGRLIFIFTWYIHAGSALSSPLPDLFS
jgi:hypothetical protein